MEFKVHLPSPQLRPFVQCYLEGDGRSDTLLTENTLFPNGYSGIFFNFGNTGKITLKSDLEVPAVSVFGQIDQHFTIQHSPGFYSLGVLMKPSVLSQLLHINMREFTNNAHDGSLIRKDLSMLRMELEDCTSVVGKICLIERLISKTISAAPYKPTIVDYALQLLQPACYPIQKVAKRLQVSERHLENQFGMAVGLSPKTYSLIVRFKRIEHQLRKLSTVRWQDLSFADEYFDQNHFIKDFKRFTGLTPTSYLLNEFRMGRTYLGA